MKKALLFLAALATLSLNAYAGNYKMTGVVSDTSGLTLPGASVSLLHPADSTLAYFSITDAAGHFQISDIKDGTYLLQVAMMGYYTEYRTHEVNAAATPNIGLILLYPNDAAMLNEVVITGERVPIRINGDTLEYNAGSFKVKPNAVVEDLLRKLPGVQVDKEGNIKSMGKDVTKVLVDGKEFFGDDPKIATKNLPADAIEKVQSFQKRSEESLFSEIDDGQREQTLNLVLREGKKTGYFGEALGAGGVPGRYEGSLKAFKFRSKTQLAALGMLNNINKFGFSLQDYLSFSGGINNLLSGGEALGNALENLPLNFGQQVDGQVNSGALGFNFATDFAPRNRLTLSYMGNGLKKKLDEHTYSRNFLPQATFESNEDAHSNHTNLNHNLNASWRATIDSVHRMSLSVQLSQGNRREDEQSLLVSGYSQALQNQLQANRYYTNTAWAGTANAGWSRKLKGKWQLVQARMNGGFQTNRYKSQWRNATEDLQSGYRWYDQQYLDNDEDKITAGAQVSAVRGMGKSYFLEPAIHAAFDRQQYDRRQGLNPELRQTIDSLSPVFYRDFNAVAGSISLRRNKKKTQWHAGAKVQINALNSWLNNTQETSRNFVYLLPEAGWRREFRNGEDLSLRYRTSLRAPSAQQLLPVTNYNNPLITNTGNTELKPEYTQHLDIHYTRFDNFSMTTFFAIVNARYTSSRLGWARWVSSDLKQHMQWANVGPAGNLSASAQYSRPVRRLGLKVNVDWNESWDRAGSPVNNIENMNNTFNHSLSGSVNNINNDKLDIRLGASVSVTQARYSINKELNNNFYNYRGTAQISYQPSPNWYFTLMGYLSHYTAKTFDAPVTIPLLQAEVSRHIFANQRGTISIKAFDLLDKNKAINRSSQANMLIEQRSNIIGRYVMVSFAYKLNRSGKSGEAPGTFRVRRS